MNRAFISAWVVLLVIGIEVGDAFAGRGTLTGVGPWTAHCAVYAEVGSVKDLAIGRVAVTLRVRATLTGAYDAAERPELETELSYGAIASAIPKPPKPDDRVVAVLYRRSDGHYFIEPANLLFMPDYAGLLVVKGFDDPKVADIITRLQKVRRIKPRPGLFMEMIMEEAKRKAEERKKEEEAREKGGKPKGVGKG